MKFPKLLNYCFLGHPLVCAPPPASAMWSNGGLIGQTLAALVINKQSALSNKETLSQQI